MVVEASPQPAQAQAPAIPPTSLVLDVSVSMVTSGAAAASAADVGEGATLL